MTADARSGSVAGKPTTKRSDWFSLPSPLRKIFNTFPLITYPENTLPERSPQNRQEHQLYIFTNPYDSSPIQLSPNPACLKWQAYLSVHDIPFQVTSSTNHASPSGALPFVIPSSKPSEPQPDPIPSSKLQRWTVTKGAKEEDHDLTLHAYMALIDQNIRNAWLYNLYLNQDNFDAVAKPLYVLPASSNTFVQLSLGRSLQAAAKEQLLSTRHFVDAEEVLNLAERAFASLSTLLASEHYFSHTDQPGLFDCSLFAYTHPLLQLAVRRSPEDLTWMDHRLSGMLSKYANLVEHRKRILRKCTIT